MFPEFVIITLDEANGGVTLLLLSPYIPTLSVPEDKSIFPVLFSFIVPSPGFPPNSFTTGKLVTGSTLYVIPINPNAKFPPTVTVPPLLTSLPFTANIPTPLSLIVLVISDSTSTVDVESIVALP